MVEVGGDDVAKSTHQIWPENGSQQTYKNDAPKMNSKVSEMVPKQLPKWYPKTDQNDVWKAFSARSGPRAPVKAHFGPHDAVSKTISGPLSAPF